MLRRRVLGSALLPMSLPFSHPRAARAAAVAAAGNRFVLVLLRGGLDGLAAVPVPGDPAHSAARGALVAWPLPPLPLSGPYALHPLLPAMQGLYRSGELAIVHATGLPDAEPSQRAQRSHFDAQHALDSGGDLPHALATGWLGRAIGGRRGAAVAAGESLVLRGSRSSSAGRIVVAGATGEVAANSNAGTRTAPTDRIADDGRDAVASGACRLASDTAALLRADTQVAVLELGGWDTHVGQAAPNGALADNLRMLDALLAALRSALRPNGIWRRTAVLVATEFGREVTANATGGTDHGSGGVAFVVGGAVHGGRVIADWPGLSQRDRRETRELRITTDLRAVQRTLLHHHLQVSRAALDSTVLPGTAGLPMIDLLRG